MRGKLIGAAAIGALSMGLGMAAPAMAAGDPPIVGPVACDRACLQGMVDKYLLAVTTHNLSGLPLAPGVRYTENGQELAIGDGFWATASAVGKYRHYFLDPRTQQAGFYGVLQENGNNVIVAVRLKLDGMRVSEIETILSRQGLGAAGPNGAGTLEAMGKPDDVWLADIPAKDKATREDVNRVANMYFSGLQNNDPHGDYSFFADDCYRLESGMQTTAGPHTPAPPPPPPAGSPAPARRPGPDMFNLSCKGGFQTGYFQIVTRIRDRRFTLVDEDKGVAFTFAFFDHSGAVREYTLNDGTVMKGGITAPFTWEIAEAFRIEHGKIRVVEAVLNNVPYGSKGGWDGH